MKILIDPTLAVLIKDFSDAQCAELLRCIFEYPNRKSDLGVWQYMKRQIEKDERKYREKCVRLNLNKVERNGLKSDMISELKSESKSGQKSGLKPEQISGLMSELESESISGSISSPISDTISAVEVEEKEINKNNININKNILKRRERSNAAKIVENSVENVEKRVERLEEFLINPDFSFDFVIQYHPKFKDYPALFPASVVETAERTLKKKRKGQWVHMAQLLDWIEKQHAFYKNSQED